MVTRAINLKVIVPRAADQTASAEALWVTHKEVNLATRLVKLCRPTFGILQFHFGRLRSRELSQPFGHHNIDAVMRITQIGGGMAIGCLFVGSMCLGCSPKTVSNDRRNLM